MRLGLLIRFIGFLLFAHFSFASQSINEQLGVRSRAMGGAGRAVSTTNEAMHINPAGLSQFQRFNLDADYTLRMNEPLHLLGVSLVDSTTSPLAGGVDFHLGVDSGSGSGALAYLGALALSYMVVENFIFVGGSAKYSFLPEIKTGNNKDIQVNQFGLDAGILARLPYGFSLGAAGYNLVPTNSRRLPLSVGLGAGFNIGGTPTGSKDVLTALGGLTLAFDWLFRDLTAPTGLEHQLSAGAEYLLLDMVPLRVGYTLALAQMEHVVTSGLGFVVNNFGLDGFYEQNVSVFDKRSFGFTMRLFF